MHKADAHLAQCGGFESALPEGSRGDQHLDQALKLAPGAADASSRLTPQPGCLALQMLGLHTGALGSDKPQKALGGSLLGAVRPAYRVPWSSNHHEAHAMKLSGPHSSHAAKRKSCHNQYSGTSQLCIWHTGELKSEGAPAQPHLVQQLPHLLHMAAHSGWGVLRRRRHPQPQLAHSLTSSCRSQACCSACLRLPCCFILLTWRLTCSVELWSTPSHIRVNRHSSCHLAG